MPNKSLRILQLTEPAQFERYKLGIARLLEHYHDVLLDASCREPVRLLENLAGSLPHVWIITDADGLGHGVYGLSSLTDEVPGRHAFIHGISDPAIRRHPGITATALTVMNYAFHRLGVLKVKAEFEADNRTATGFCRRMGFRREAWFANDNRVGDTLRDVAVYTLDRVGFRRLLARFSPSL